jgi:hypothetical protein
MPRAKIQIAMDDADFNCLAENIAEWAAIADEWAPQVSARRFMTMPPGAPLLTTWKLAYWLGGSYASVMLARAFLDAWGHDYQLVSDQSGGGGWVILTDYERKPED